jgi:hypothetical protein
MGCGLARIGIRSPRKTYRLQRLAPPNSARPTDLGGIQVANRRVPQIGEFVSGKLVDDFWRLLDPKLDTPKSKEQY